MATSPVPPLDGIGRSSVRPTGLDNSSRSSKTVLGRLLRGVADERAHHDVYPPLRRGLRCLRADQLRRHEGGDPRPGSIPRGRSGAWLGLLGPPRRSEARHRSGTSTASYARIWSMKASKSRFPNTGSSSSGPATASAAQYDIDGAGRARQIGSRQRMVEVYERGDPSRRSEDGSRRVRPLGR